MRLLIALAMVGLLALAAPAGLAAEPLRLSTGMVEPWTRADGTGFHQVLVREVFARLGLEAEVEVNPASARAFVLANDGVTDGLAGRVAGIEDEYPNLIRVPERMFVNDFVACAAQPESTPASWAALAPRAVAHILGWQVFEHNLPTVRELTRTKDTQQLLNLLKAGRTEVILHERWQILSQAKAAGIALHVQEPPLTRVPMYIYLHRRHADQVDKVAATLRTMKADGSYEAIAETVFGGLGSAVTGLK
ncbi:ABC transporter substrate-binding protein [Magnetospirillum sp. UT-4]|uniref:substrate-binding periplasmic protein n=1 Tax=Magnetospirillum sp. UT-4 TaxID=2681467 RepID=UPI001385513B|nr:transporter substrate-binding domain-containing protein [Magnetospirillum sp. UT-4]CAA7613216.1 conserved exported hypothetical protein [Magnetospirillum sp. UT-4]